MTDRTDFSYREAKLALFVVAILGFYNTWGLSLVNGSVGLLLEVIHGERPLLPGTNELLKTSITGIYWPFDYLLNILIVFFWEAVDGSHPTTSAVGVYFLGQYFSILVSVYIDNFRFGNAGQWKLAPAAWLLAFQIMAAASVAPFYTIVYISVSPLTSGMSFPQLAEKSLAPPTSTRLLPLSLTASYLAPAIVMALPSPSLVSNGFKQIAVVIWNVFPLLVSFAQRALDAVAAGVGRATTTTTTKPTAGQHLSAVRFAYMSGLAVSIVTHTSVLSLSLSTVIFRFLFRSEYARALGPRALLVPPVAWTTVSSLGEGVRSFFLWDQVFTYLTMLILGYVQLKTLSRASGASSHFVSMVGLMAMGFVFMGPGSVILIINWARDEELLGHMYAYQDDVRMSSASRKKAST